MLMMINSQIIAAIIGSFGLILVFSGVLYKAYPEATELMFTSKTKRFKSPSIAKLVDFLYMITSVPVLNTLRDKIESISISASKSLDHAKFKASGITLCIMIVGCINMWFLRGIGKLWYTKLLAMGISLFLPYYILTLILDLQVDKINRQVPRLVDEFRGAFLKHNRIKPALLESAKITGGKLGIIIERAVLSTDVSESLQNLKNGLNNIWFSIFVQLLINYRTNGGELIDQLYRLNKTMVLYNNLEKKKSKRLIWYEIFAICAAIVSIPIIYFVNSAILGSTGFVASDAQSNLIVSRVLGLSMFSLIVIRILRKL